MSIKVYLFIIFTFVNFSQSLKVLVLFENFAPSHFKLYGNLFKTLASNGHNVTVVSQFPQEKPLPNYRDISLRTEDVIPPSRIVDINKVRSPKFEMYSSGHLAADIAEITCKHLMTHPNVKSFLKEHNTYDIILIEKVFSNCIYGITKKFKAPTIGLSTCISLPWINPMYGVPDNPAYIPNMFLDHSDRMGFFARVENTVLLVFHKLMYEILMKRPGNELSKKYFGEDIISGEDMDYSTSLLLSNTHFSFTRPRPLPPNVIEVAGIHITADKPLPRDLERYINESPHGVVYMSMGSMLKGVTFPQEQRIKFLNAFSRLKERVIWKWENETMEGKPDNVLLSKWTPQKDLLCHPNVKAFISHGGLLGTLESVHCAVPMLVIPQFGDQHTNAALVEENRFGVKMLLSEINEKSILKNLKIILTEHYQKQAKEVSRRFRDRPLPPMETALYWINYVAKHGGAKFMRTAAVDMPFYQYYLLDVIAFILFVPCIGIFISYKILMLILAAYCNKSSPTSKYPVIPEMIVPQKEVPQKEVPQKEVPQKQVPQKEVPQKQVPQKQVPQKEVPQKEVPQKKAHQRKGSKRKAKNN